MSEQADRTSGTLRFLELHAQAFSLRYQIRDKASEGTTRYNIAAVYKSLNRLDEAEAQLLAVVALDEAIGHPDLERDRAMLEEVQTTKRAQAPGS